MEKRGVVEPGRTNATETPMQPRPGTKQASNQTRSEQLDDDFTKRASDAAASKLQKPGS